MVSKAKFFAAETRQSSTVRRVQWKRLKNKLSEEAEKLYLRIPDVYTFIKGAAGQVPAIRTESYTVHRFLMFCQSMNTNSSVNIP